VGEYLQVFRARVPQQSVAALLEIRPAAIAEAQRLCPELLRAQLVRLDDGTWLGTWEQTTWDVNDTVAVTDPPEAAGRWAASYRPCWRVATTRSASTPKPRTGSTTSRSKWSASTHGGRWSACWPRRRCITWPIWTRSWTG
jgi:hypothetical protein